MSSWTELGTVLGLGSTVLLFGVFLYLYAWERSRPLFWFSIAWGVYIVRFICELAEATGLQTVLSEAVVQLLVLVSSYFLVIGAASLLNRPVPRWFTYSSGGAVVVVEALFLFPQLVMAATILGFVIAGFLYLWIGVMFFKSRDASPLGGRMLAILFVIWGLHKFGYPFLRQLPTAAAWNFAASAILGTGIAIAVLLYYLGITRTALQRSESLYRLLSENAGDVIFRYAFVPRQRFEYISPSATTIIGYAPEDHYADPSLLYDRVYPGDRSTFDLILAGKAATAQTYRIVHKNGAVVWLEQLSTYVRGDNGQILAMEGICRDVTARIEREEELRRSEERFRVAVSQKEELLQELHHQVNNNLTIILSLVDFEIRRYGAPVASALRKIQRRVMSIALIHMLLYNSKDSRRIDFARYCRSVVDYVLDSHMTRDVSVLQAPLPEIEMSISAGYLYTGTAKSCGLIIAELVANCLEHAFGNGEAGRVKLSFDCVNNNCTLIVADNGRGFSSGYDWHTAADSGLHIVRSLGEELQASIDIQSGTGLRVVISFPAVWR